MDKVTVCLVGAGPGDPGLITVKGLKLLREADVVIYDRLVNRRLLQEVRPEAECIYVGKAVGGAIRQDEINTVLIAKAREGKRVVRLKGGDPFVFGRGGEEAEALHAAGIRYEIVPGVTSAVAVPAYAGIPITHRKLSSALTITTGCEDPVEISDLDWEALARGGTLVFLMSVRHLGAIAERLIAWGRHPDTPSAVIAQGTMPQQRTVTGTLGTIALLAVRACVRPPAILVVGEVVRLRERLAWFEERPLFGRRVVVPQVREQEGTLVHRLEELGAEVVESSTTRIVPRGNNDRLNETIGALLDADAIIFTSSSTVRNFVSAVGTVLNERTVVACMGLMTAKTARAMGLRVDAVTAEFAIDGLMEALTAALIQEREKVLRRAARAISRAL